MKTLFFFAVIMVTGVSQAQTLFNCQDSSREFYKVVRQNQSSSQAVLQKLNGNRIVAARGGKLEAAGQLNTYFVTISDRHGVFLLIGADAHSSGFLTGTVDAFGVRRGITCRLQE